MHRLTTANLTLLLAELRRLDPANHFPSRWAVLASDLEVEVGGATGGAVPTPTVNEPLLIDLETPDDTTRYIYGTHTNLLLKEMRDHFSIISCPAEIHLQIFSYLDPVTSTTLGLTNHHFYDIHRHLHPQKISLRTECPNRDPLRYINHSLGGLLSDWLLKLGFAYHFPSEGWKKFEMVKKKQVFLIDKKRREEQKRRDAEEGRRCIGCW